MNKREAEILSSVFYNDKDVERFCADLVGQSGIDKTLEFIRNFSKLTGQIDSINGEQLMKYIGYEYVLSDFLFKLLRVQEDQLKGFLCNTYNDYPVEIEERPSNYAKTKYYFKIPYGFNKFIDIRTFNYEEGPVDYYDALKTMDFGDVNIIFSHQDWNIIRKFSNNPNIIEDMDLTRRMRNYVYHHNILFSLGKKMLKDGIVMVLRNLPHDLVKQSFIDELKNIANEVFEEEKELRKQIAITLTKSDIENIFSIKSIIR